MMNGYVKLWRSFDLWGWRRNPNAVTVFLYCLTHARHEPGQYQGIELQPGQLVTGRDAISRVTGLTTQSVRTALKNLQKTGELTIKSTNRFSIVTVVNWAKYQTPDTTTNQQPNQQLTNKQPATNQQLTTNKNVKNVRMDKVDWSSVSTSIFEAVCRGWKTPSQYIVDAMKRLVDQYGEHFVLEAIDTALEHDTKGGLSVAFVEKILSNMKSKTKPRTRLEQYCVVVNGEVVERTREVPVN